MSVLDPAARQRQLAGSLRALRDRIAVACDLAHRDPAELTLIAVTKTFPSSDVELLADLGVTDIGENRDQEARGKVAALTQRWGEPAQARVRWHFIGGLQTNKCRSVTSYAHLVHSVDRPRLVDALAGAAQGRATPLRCLVQVDLDIDPKPGRSGAPVADVPAIADAIAASSALQLDGVMAVAPLGGDPRRAFERLAAVTAALRRDHPEATVVSAGMSGDLEAAIACGATHLRVGAALLGSRPHAR
ncbi:MAG TPA: YggS family pyridoxal phosphate-dependent enzyme [Acidothermaceae bacterium]